jgi:hypothetical protein
VSLLHVGNEADGESVAHTTTLRCRLMASDRATWVERSRSFTAPVSLPLRMKSRMFGMATAASTPAKATVIINSKIVKP